VRSATSVRINNTHPGDRPNLSTMRLAWPVALRPLLHALAFPVPRICFGIPPPARSILKKGPFSCVLPLSGCAAWPTVQQGRIVTRLSQCSPARSTTGHPAGMGLHPASTNALRVDSLLPAAAAPCNAESTLALAKLFTARNFRATRPIHDRWSSFLCFVSAARNTLDEVSRHQGICASSAARRTNFLGSRST
jgi:hypothetical protein